MKISKPILPILFLLLGILPSAMAQSPAVAKQAVPYPTAATPKAIDRGELKAQPEAATPISVTIALRMSNESEAESLLKSLHTPGDPQFHQFLTAAQFVARFGPAESDVAKVIASLTKYGLTVERTTATTLKVTGLPAAMENAFTVSLHSYEVPAHGNAVGYIYHAPLGHPTIPSEISGSVAAVVGLDTRPSFHPLHVSVPQQAGAARSPAPSATPATLNFGSLTVTDFAKYYDVDPLYKKGVTGAGRTLGIMTFAALTPSDAYKYWKSLGLDVPHHRIHILNVDGGPGAPSDASGSLETTLDVEQSGGIAPGAQILVYQGPNTDQAFVDVFAAAIDANKADTLSVSWGDWEWFQNFENAPVTDPITGNTVSTLDAGHELFVRAAIQGQTVFAASGDGGAYDVNDDLGCYGPYSASQPYSCTQPLSVDYPASDPAITGAGGTTLPGVQENCLNINSGCTAPYFAVDVPHERVWGWDYLEGWCAAMGEPDPLTCGIYLVGGGGGVSIHYLEPAYQWGIPGVQLSQPGQIYQAGSGFAGEGLGLFYALPPFFPGRNVPDVSFNADPFTGYEVSYTSDQTGFSVQSGWGGTSFVAPDLNGVSALLGDYLGGRFGLLNFPLYDLVRNGQAYGDDGAPLRAIKYGDNWFYHGSDGYNPGAGVGTMDVAKFAEALRGLH